LNTSSLPGKKLIAVHQGLRFFPGTALTSGLGLETLLPRPQAFGLSLKLSIFFDPSSSAMTTSPSLPKAGNRDYSNRDYVVIVDHEYPRPQTLSLTYIIQQQQNNNSNFCGKHYSISRIVFVRKPVTDINTN